MHIHAPAKIAHSKRYKHTSSCWEQFQQSDDPYESAGGLAEGLIRSSTKKLKRVPFWYACPFIPLQDESLLV